MLRVFGTRLTLNRGFSNSIFCIILKESGWRPSALCTELCTSHLATIVCTKKRVFLVRQIFLIGSKLHENRKKDLSLSGGQIIQMRDYINCNSKNGSFGQHWEIKSSSAVNLIQVIRKSLAEATRNARIPKRRAVDNNGFVKLTMMDLWNQYEIFQTLQTLVVCPHCGITSESLQCSCS